MSFAWLILGLLCALGLLKSATSEMFQEEAKTRLEHLPVTLIRLAALGLPKEMRDDIAAEWQAELASVLRDTDGLPLTRLLRGVLYATGMFRAAILITQEVSGDEPVVSSLPEPNFLDLTGFEFERLVVRLFQQTGFATVSQPNARGDGGIDIVALNNSPLVGGRVVVTAKRGASL